MATNIAMFPLGLPISPMKAVEQNQLVPFFSGLLPQSSGVANGSYLSRNSSHLLHFNFVVTSEENLLRRSTSSSFTKSTNKTISVGIQLALLSLF
jgi:hypothetical protein